MTVATPSRLEMRQWVGALGGWFVAGREFSPTGTPSPAQLYSVETPFAADDDPHGLTFYINAGAAQGQERLVASHAAGLMGSGSRFYFDRAFASTPSTNSVFELWGGPNIPQVHRALDAAVMAAQRRILLPHEDFSAVLGDPLRNGQMGQWVNGGSAAPTNWNLTQSGTTASVTRQAGKAVIFSGRYAAELQNEAGESASLDSDDFVGWQGLKGKTFTLKARVRASVADRVTIVVDDGVGTSVSSAMDRVFSWTDSNDEVLSVEHTVAAAATRLRVKVAISSGASITALVGRVWTIGLPANYEVPLSDVDGERFVYLSEVHAESPYVPGVFDVPVPAMDGYNEIWRVRGAGSTKVLEFTEYANTYLGEALKLAGQRSPKLPTADSDLIEMDPEFVRLRAAVEITDMLGGPSERDLPRYSRWVTRANERLNEMAPTVLPGSTPVEAV